MDQSGATQQLNQHPDYHQMGSSPPEPIAMPQPPTHSERIMGLEARNIQQDDEIKQLWEHVARLERVIGE